MSAASNTMLPRLPMPESIDYADRSLYTADQMRDYALAALDARPAATTDAAQGEWVRVPREPVCGPRYTAGDWSRRNWEAALEDQAASPQAPESGVEFNAEAKTALGFVYDHLEAMDNQDTPLTEIPQRIVDALAGAGWAVVPRALPFAVLGEAGMMLETGNPKFMWDFLIAKTRIYPRCAPDASIAAAYMTPSPSATVTEAMVYAAVRSVGVTANPREWNRLMAKTLTAALRAGDER